INLDAHLDIVRESGPRQIIDDLKFVVRKGIGVEKRRGTGSGGFDESGRTRLVGATDRNGGIPDIDIRQIDALDRVAVFRRIVTELEIVNQGWVQHARQIEQAVLRNSVVESAASADIAWRDGLTVFARIAHVRGMAAVDIVVETDVAEVFVHI